MQPTKERAAPAASSPDALERLLVYAFFLLLAFEDSLLQSTPLGYAGASAAVLPLLLIMAKRFLLNGPPRSFLVYLGYTLLVSGAFALVYQDRPLDTLVDRGARSFLLYTLYVYAFLYFRSTCVHMGRPVLVLAVIVFASIALSVLARGYLDGVSVFHYNASVNLRPRGLSLEASTYGYLIVASMLLFGWMYELRFAVVIALAVVASALVQSKGAISALGCAAILYFLLRKGVAVHLKILVLIPLLVGVALVLPVLQALYMSDIDNYTSVATRSTMALVALRSLLSAPLGHGFTGFLPYVHEHGREAANYLTGISPLPLNMSEVSEYFKEGAYKNVGAKSLLFDSMIYLGFPFLIYAYRLVRRHLPRLAESSSASRAVLAYFTLISLAFYIPGVGSYISAAALGLCFNEYVMDDRSGRCRRSSGASDFGD